MIFRYFHTILYQCTKLVSRKNTYIFEKVLITICKVGTWLTDKPIMQNQTCINVPNCFHEKLSVFHYETC